MSIVEDDHMSREVLLPTVMWLSFIVVFDPVRQDRQAAGRGGPLRVEPNFDTGERNICA